MSYHKNPEISCDFGGKNTYQCNESYSGLPRDTVDDMRRYLRAQGWVFRDGLDLCSDHAAPSRGRTS